MARILYDTALLESGFVLTDPSKYAERSLRHHAHQPGD